MKTKLLSLCLALLVTTALWASNTITYTATRKLRGSDGSLNVGATTFGSAIKAHTFSNGIGEIICTGKITMIAEDAFEDCSGLTSITIPNSVKRIGEEAFDECYGVTSITSHAATPPTCGDDCFDHVDKSIPVYVPAQSVDAYKQANGWRDFENILPIRSVNR